MTAVGRAGTDPENVESMLDAVTDAFRAAAKQIVFDDAEVDSELLRWEGLRYATRFFNVGLASELEYHDPANPHFCRAPSPYLNWGYPNPDGSYLWTMIDGNHDYRVFGHRGSAHLFDVEAWEGDYADLRNCRVSGGRRDILGGKSDLQVNDDGSFEVILSKTVQGSNWIPIVPGAGHIYIRQWFYDWENEKQGTIHIERLGAHYPAEMPTERDYATRFNLLLRFLKATVQPIRAGVQQHYDAEPGTVAFPNDLLLMDTGKSVSFRNQFYARGQYQVSHDEAIILEVVPPDAQYWLFHLLSHFWEMSDSRYRQISVNGHQATIDDDGVFRAVISHQDPGVPNWLDATGRPKGLIGGRYNWTDSVPIPTLRKVPFNSLKDELPPSTPRITPQERSEILRRRILAARSRGTDW